LEALRLDLADPPSRFDGLAPYWRAAYEEDWGNYSLMFGTFGMSANVAPLGNQSAPTDQITDVGGDAQFQYIDAVNAVTARLTYASSRTWIISTGSALYLLNVPDCI